MLEKFRDLVTQKYMVTILYVIYLITFYFILIYELFTLLAVLFVIQVIFNSYYKDSIRQLKNLNTELFDKVEELEEVIEILEAVKENETI